LGDRDGEDYLSSEASSGKNVNDILAQPIKGRGMHLSSQLHRKHWQPGRKLEILFEKITKTKMVGIWLKWQKKNQNKNKKQLPGQAGWYPSVIPTLRRQRQ
jgi:hypothetical protein